MKRMIPAVLLLVLLLSACGSAEEKLSGTWELESGKADIREMTLYSDGTCIVMEDEMGTWNISDGVLKVTGNYGGLFWSYDGIIGEYKLSGDTLTVEDNIADDGKPGSLVYTKVQ